MFKKMEPNIVKANKDIARHTIKDSVFTDLLTNPDYLLEVYHLLHPEDAAATIADLERITIANTLTNNLYNDLGFVARDRLLILIEAQSTWTSNIIFRMVEYAIQTIRQYCKDHKQNPCQIPKLEFPRPELYLIYTGKGKEDIDTLMFSKEFFGGSPCDIEVKVHLIHANPERNDIITQYILFARIYDEQRKIYGRDGSTAIKETIRICKDRNILKAYLTKHSNEVYRIMFNLFTQEGAVDNYGDYREQQGLEKGLAEGRAEGRLEGRAEEKEESIKLLISKYKKFGLSEKATGEELANDFHLSPEIAFEKVRLYWN